MKHPLHRYLAGAALALVLACGSAQAARLRIHYAVDPSGNLAPQGETERGRVCPQRIRPNCVKPFRHPCTGQMVNVPLALPEGTPTIEHRWRGVVYNYGSYAVEVVFVQDGSVDVVYNSGWLRGL